MSRRYAKAAQAFEDFTGRQARGVTKAQLQDTSAVGWKMGPAVGIAYEATRDGVKSQYFHEFAKSARPDLVARDDGRQLFLTGGKYTVTERGIEDMPELFIVNPSPRRAGARKGKTMAAAKRNRSGQFVKRGRAAGAPKRGRRRAARQVAIFKTNPGPKRRRRPAAAARKRRTYKRNPSGGRHMFGSFGKMLVPAMGVGGGAVLSEVMMSYLPIPANFKSGVLRHVTKGAVGVAAGLVLGKFLKQKKLGIYVAIGAIVIATHDALKEIIAARLPDVTFGGYGQYVRPLPSQFGGMGYANPAQLTQLSQYVPPLGSQFAGVSQAYDNPGGETDFRA